MYSKKIKEKYSRKPIFDNYGFQMKILTNGRRFSELSLLVVHFDKLVNSYRDKCIKHMKLRDTKHYR